MKKILKIRYIIAFSVSLYLCSYAFSLWDVYRNLSAWKIGFYYVHSSYVDEPEIHSPNYIYIPKEYYYWVYKNRTPESIQNEKPMHNSMALILDSSSMDNKEETLRMLDLMSSKGLSFNTGNLSSIGCSPIQDNIVMLSHLDKEKYRKEYEKTLWSTNVMKKYGADLQFKNVDAEVDFCKKTSQELLDEFSILLE